MLLTTLYLSHCHSYYHTMENSNMSLRQRPTPAKQSSISETPPTTTTSSSAATAAISEPDTPTSPPLPRGALSQTLTSTANLAKLLPTGTLLAFQILTPIFTNNGACDSVTHVLAAFLLVLLAISCFLACFTDSVKASDGQVYHGLATFKGMWVFDYPDPSGSGLPDLSNYKVRLIDWVHAVLSMLVFGAVALRDKNVLSCFYPKPGHETQEVLDIVPMGIGIICSFLFVVFPTSRRGIGYPVTRGN